MGADDNASAVAVQLETARQVMLLKGSQALDSSVVWVSFPLMFFGYPKDGNFIGIVGNFDSRGLARSIHGSFSKNPNLPAIRLTVPFNGWILPAVRLSGHASFWDAGFKAVMITDSAFYRNPHYHFPSDRPETLDCRFMAELVQSLVTFLAQPP